MNNITLLEIQPIIRYWLKQLFLLMKLIAIFFTVVLLQASSYGYGQKVTLRDNSMKLDMIFKELNKQTGYKFLYDNLDIQSSPDVNIDIKDVTLEEALDNTFSMIPFSYKIFGNTVVIKKTAERSGTKQNRTVSGKVFDENGAPVFNVNVTVKGTNAATVTNQEGAFSIEIPASSSTLVFSSVGYERQEIITGANSNLQVYLAASESRLDEVVVVGYGTQRRADVIGSVSQIKGEELTQAPAMNITNTLAGRLPGLTVLQQSGRPGADDAGLRIRGTSSYTGSASPLIIIDGVQRPSFSHLDASEIESITLLKDAVSTAVYGLQATNGIVLITTKKGQQQKPTISYNGSVQIGSNTRFPKFLNGPDYMEWYNKGIEVDNDYNMHTGVDPAPFIYSQDQINALRNGTNENPLFGNTDWVGELVDRNSISQHHSITVNGGTESIRYFTSVSYLDQDGVIEKTNFKRYNVRSNVDADLSSVLNVALNLGLRQQHTNTPGISPDNTAYMNPFYQAARMLPNLPMFAENGMYTAHNSNAGWVSPLAAIAESGYQNALGNVFQGDLTFNVKVPWVEGLSAKVLTAYDFTGTENKSWLAPYATMGRQRDQVNGNFIEIPNPPGITRTTLRQSYHKNFRRTFQPSINYKKQFGEHSINALALYEWSRYSNNLFSGGANNFPLEGLHEIDFGSKAPEDLVTQTGSSGLDSRAGYVGRLNYSFKETYLVEAAARYDASINFPVENRWDIFPAFALGWIASNESFVKDNISALDYLKFKGSWGKTGRENISNFTYMQTYSLTTSPVVVVGGKPIAAVFTNAIPNSDIKWETARTANFGFESTWLDGKLGVDIEGFYRVTTDILAGVGGLYPLSLGGYYPAFTNFGIVDNRGIDLQIRHNNKLGEFEYGITGNLNWAKNKIIRRDEISNLPLWRRTVGGSVGDKYGFLADGFYQNWEETGNAISPSAGPVAPGYFKYTDINGDGRITRDDDFVKIGRSNMPELMFGLNFNFKYKNLDLSALFQGATLSTVALGGTYEGSAGVTTAIDANTVFTRSFDGFGNSPYYIVENSWSPDNPNASFPRLSSSKASLSPHNVHVNSGWMRDGSYLRLKAAQIGFAIPKRLTSSIDVQQVRFFVSGSNLFTWDHLKFLDPEMPNVSNGFYPQQRIISGGLTVTF